MILAIDVGNTDITFGTVRDGVIGTVARVHTERDYTVAEYGMKLKALLEYYGVDPLGFEGAILASVVPPVTNTLRLAVNRLTGLDCLIVGPGIRTGLNVDKEITNILDKDQQPLIDESWGVQAKLKFDKYDSEIDTKRGFRVYFRYFVGDSPWGYDRWESAAGASGFTTTAPSACGTMPQRPAITRSQNVEWL